MRAFADNVKEMKDAMTAIKCENVANFTSGFEYAFEILHRVRSPHGLFRILKTNRFLLFSSIINQVKVVNVIKR